MFFSSCASDAAFVTEVSDLCDGTTAPMKIWNRSQFEVTAVMIHDDSDPADAVNVLSAPLEPDAWFETDFDDRQHVSFTRERASAGEMLVITTNERICADAADYSLVIFDDSFRLLEPDSPENTPPPETEVPF